MAPTALYSLRSLPLNVNRQCKYVNYASPVAVRTWPTLVELFKSNINRLHDDCDEKCYWDRKMKVA
jgi:hypothetical protein